MLQQLMETTKHGLAAGHDRAPERPDWTIPQGWSRYTAQEHAVWRTLFERQSRLLPGRACDAFLQGMRDPDVPWQHALKLVEHLAGEEVTLTLINDGDHRLSRDQDIARLVAAVAATVSGR